MNTMNTPANQNRTPDEPEITQEEDVPLDGRDHEGEEMMKEVGNDRMASTTDDETSRKAAAGQPAEG
ncbi:MAG: hypothetical protein JWQ88_3337 [Rhodoferax sp.]|nr:hypothetical protein [Rhodoferax sp.]